MYNLSRRSLSNLVGVEALLAYVVTEAIKVTKQNFMVLDGVRTSREQAKLVQRGVSKTTDSYHLYGLAVDLVAYVDGAPSWEEKYYPAIDEAMSRVMREHNITGIDWGYRLWGWDMAHFQRTGMKPYYDIRKYNEV